jgi:hypothetical protein
LAEKWKNGKMQSQWYAKYLGEKRDETLAELLIQNAMRMVHSDQPKTRRMINITKNQRIKYSILSKEILFFNDKFFLKQENNESILNNSITGLAATQILALWLNEVDFKAGNVGVDERVKKVIKIDGGLSFIPLNADFSYLHQRNFKITKEDLEALPNLVNYEACNWLHHIQWNEKGYALKMQPTELDKRINQSPHFKNELYRTILRVISLPDLLIQFFTQSYIANLADVTRFSNFIIARKQQLALAAEEIPAFNEYRQSNQARAEMLDFLNYLRTFKTMGKSFLLSEFDDIYKMNIEAAILGNAIKEYTPIKNFAIELDHYLERLNFTIDFNTLEFNSDMLLPNREKIISEIRSLKEAISKFLTSPTIVENKDLHNKLSDVAKAIKGDPKIENSIISDLIWNSSDLM